MIDQAGWIFIVVAAICVVIVGFALKTGRIIGVAFRSRFIARREAEPLLYWMSITIFAGLGILLAYAVISVNFFES